MVLTTDSIACTWRGTSHIRCLRRRRCRRPCRPAAGCCREVPSAAALSRQKLPWACASRASVPVLHLFRWRPCSAPLHTLAFRREEEPDAYTSRLPLPPPGQASFEGWEPQRQPPLCPLACSLRRATPPAPTPSPTPPARWSTCWASPSPPAAPSCTSLTRWGGLPADVCCVDV